MAASLVALKLTAPTLVAATAPKGPVNEAPIVQAESGLGFPLPGRSCLGLATITEAVGHS